TMKSFVTSVALVMALVMSSSVLAQGYVAYLPAPVVSYYAPAPVISAGPVVATSYYAPAPYVAVAPAPYYVASPVVTPYYVASPVVVGPVYYGRPVVVHPKVYYPGQPVRN